MLEDLPIISCKKKYFRDLAAIYIIMWIRFVLRIRIESYECWRISCQHSYKNVNSRWNLNLNGWSSWCVVWVQTWPTPTAVAGVRFSPSIVCLFFRTISQKSMQQKSPNLTQQCFTMSSGNAFNVNSKGQRSKSQVMAYGSLHSCECWLFLVRVKTIVAYIYLRDRWRPF